MERLKCNCVGLLSGGVYDKMHDIGRRVYDTEGIAPTLNTCSGGNLETKIIVDEEGNVLVNGKRARIRKLTERERFRLQGVKDEDFEKIAKNQSRSSLNHLSGDSICVDVLMAIFNQMI